MVETTLKFDNFKDTSVLITGGLGFIGSNLAIRLVELGARVTIMDASIAPYGANIANIKEIKNKVVVMNNDVRQFDVLKDAIAGKDIVFHLAGQVSRLISMENPKLDMEMNCLGMINVLEACRKYNDSAKIVYASTRGVIGEPVYLPVDELHPLNPTDIYGVNKLAAEKYCRIYNSVYGTRTTALRLNNVYGPRCQMRYNHYGILNWFIGLALLDKVLPVYGDGSQTRDYVYIEDVINAFLLSVSNKANGEVFFVGSGVETRFIDMVNIIIDCVGRGKYQNVPFPELIAKVDIKRFSVNINKIKRTLSWEPKTTIREGIRKTVEFCRSNLKSYL